VFALKPFAPVLSLGVLYLFAVLPVAAWWGLPYALAVSVVSMLAFNFLFLPPRHTFRLAESENWVALAVYLVTAVIVSGLAARARRRAEEAEQREREAALAADVSATLLESRAVEPQLGEIAARVGHLLGAAHTTIELGSTSGAGGYDLLAGERHVGRLYLDSEPDGGIAGRVLPMVASLLATAIDREELARDAREKTAVLRSVSHDLRSPITAVMTATELLRGDGGLSAAEKDELLASIRTQGLRLERSVSNLLDLSRLETGAAKPMLELWTVDSLIAHALEAIGTENERVDVLLPTEPVAVRVDAMQLEHALVNLLENALKFSGGERVDVRADSANGEVVVRVIDRGPGIATAEHAEIFEPFNRGTSGDGSRGSGLGLAIARGFVEVNGGRLWVESRPGEGATFAVALPAIAIPAGSST
jgi:two-component system sensor histidine kinase KdpD